MHFQEIRAAGQPHADDTADMKRIRADFLASITKRHGEILADSHRTALLAAFFHPHTCRQLITFDERGHTTAQAKALLNGDDEGFRGIIEAIKDDLPEGFEKDEEEDCMGVKPQPEVNRQVHKYLTLLRDGVIPSAADVDVLALASRADGPYATIPIISVLVGSMRDTNCTLGFQSSLSSFPFLPDACRQRRTWPRTLLLLTLKSSCR